MKKQKIKAENLYRAPFRDVAFRAVATDNFKDAVSRFLRENYADAYTLTTGGTFPGFIRLIPADAAAFLTSVFRGVCLRSLIDISLVGDRDTLSISLAFPSSLPISRETAATWITLAESSGFFLETRVENGKAVLQVSTRVYVFTTEVRSAVALYDFYQELLDAENAARA